MVRPKVRAERVGEVEAAVKAMFEAIEDAQPAGVRYASCRLSDGVTFVVLLAVEDGLENPLLELPAFQAFQARLQDWVAEPPSAEPLTVIGSYRLF